MLSPVTNAFEIILEHCDANLGNYLVENKWNRYMLKTIIRYAIFHYQPTNDKNEQTRMYKKCSHIILQKQLLHGIVRMTGYVCIIII